MQRVYEENEWGKVSKRIITNGLDEMGGTPFSANEVESPNCIDWPAISVSKKIFI